MTRNLTSYYKGRTLIYVRDAQHEHHWTTEAHWEEYLALRRTTPKIVVMFSKRCDLQSALLKEGILV